MAAAEATSLDTVLGGRVALRQPLRGHRVGHDAILLAAAAPASTTLLADLGAGVGGAGLAALARLPNARAVLVEIDPSLADLAEANAAANGYAMRCRVVCADVNGLGRAKGPETPGPASCDLVLANPPFNAVAAHRTSPHPGRAQAHMAPDGLIQDWIVAAYRCLVPGGMLVMILRPADMAGTLAALAGRFGAAELLPIHPRPDAPAVRLLIRAVKGRKTPPTLQPGLVLQDRAGRATPEAEAVLRDAAPLPHW